MATLAIRYQSKDQLAWHEFSHLFPEREWDYEPAFTLKLTFFNEPHLTEGYISHALKYDLGLIFTAQLTDGLGGIAYVSDGSGELFQVPTLADGRPVTPVGFRENKNGQLGQVRVFVEPEEPERSIASNFYEVSARAEWILEGGIGA